MNRTFWQGFLMGSLVFGMLGMWASPRRRYNPWVARRRALMRGAAELWRASRQTTRRLARQAGR